MVGVGEREGGFLEREVACFLVSWGRLALWEARNRKVESPSDSTTGAECYRGWERGVVKEVELCAHREGQAMCHKKWGKVKAALGR